MDTLKVIRRSPMVAALGVLAAVATLFISEGSYWQAINTLGQLAASQDIRTSLRDLQGGLLDAETAQRGYLLTHRKEYLQPLANGAKEVKESLAELGRSFAGDPEVGPVLGRLSATASAKLTELDETIRLYDAGQREVAMALILGGQGIAQMDLVRALDSELLARQTKIRDKGRDDLFATLSLSRAAMAALTAVGLVALFLYLRQAGIVEAHRIELKRVAQAVNDRLDAEVKQRTAQLTKLAHHLQSAREDERARLARNLHDELGALLTSAKLDAARIKARLAGTAPEARERLAHLVETLNASIALGRSIIEDLHPSTLANLGLASAIEILAREFGERSGVQVHCDLAPVKLRPSAELMIYRLVQEAITNVSKYAKAGQVWVSLAAQAGQLQVSVRDDGIGFDPALQAGSAYGLVGMRFRVEAEGGVLTVVSAPGQGTRVQASLPESA